MRVVTGAVEGRGGLWPVGGMVEGREAAAELC